MLVYFCACAQVHVSIFFLQCVDYTTMQLHIVVITLDGLVLVQKENYINSLASVQFHSFDQSCPTLCDPMDCSRPGLPVHHQLPEFIQTHVH